MSHSIGGLSNVWGATVTGVTENDLKDTTTMMKLTNTLKQLQIFFLYLEYETL